MPGPEAPTTTRQRWLAIDGALGSFSAAVVDGDRAVAAAASPKQALEEGLALVDQVLTEAGLHVGEIDALAVGLGPGSFTGLRIAVSYAKGLAFALGRPLVGVSSYDIVEGQPKPAPPVLAVVTGRVGMGCARLRTVDGVWTRCGSFETIVQFVAGQIDPGDLVVCAAVEGVAAQLGERGFIVRALPFPSSPALAAARLAAERFAGGAPPARSPHDVQPDYGELPAAEVPKPAQR